MPVIASLTTIARRTESLKETVESLLPQVDKLNVFLHGYNSVPEFLDNEKIEVAMDLEWGDHGDLDKFHWADDLPEDSYHFICDDDLIYPPDYVSNTLSVLANQKNTLFTYHGSIPYRLPIASYYDDRFVFPCLGDVPEMKKVSIGGTGVMAYHTSIGFKGFRDQDKTPNMADIHMALWAGQNDIEIMVLPHEAGWIKHSDKVNQNETIFAQQRYKTFEQVEIINANPDIFQSYVSSHEYPLVSVVVINSRMKSHPHFVKQCFDSIRSQSYPYIEPIVINNFDRMITIGKAYNKAVEQAKGKWVLFVGDDDFISNDYVSSLVTLAEDLIIAKPEIKGVTSYLTLFHSGNTNITAQEKRELVPTGMWLKDFIEEKKFTEYITKLVDSEFIDRIKEEGYEVGTLTHHYGYYYRSHPHQVSGHKAFKGDNGTTKHNIKEFKSTVEEFK